MLGPALITSLIVSLSSPPGHQTPLMSFHTNIGHGVVYLADQLLIRTRDHVVSPALENELESMGCRKFRQLGKLSWFRVNCDHDTSIEKRLSRLEKNSQVIWVEPSYVETIEEAPNDLSTYQWHHHNEGQSIQDIVGIPGADMDSLAAWDDTIASAGPIIALIDMGILSQHEDLHGQMAQNTDEVCDNDIDDDDNGYIDDCWGWDFGEQDNDPSPKTLPDEKSTGSVCRNWHATGIASLAGAVGNNAVGIAGVHWQARFLNLKKYPDESCVSTTSHSIEAIGYALGEQADILILAFSSSAFSLAYQELLSRANEQGVFVVMSSGNGSRDVDESIRFPNNYAVTYRVTVANTDPTDRLWETSNWGATKVDLAAPGTHLLMAGIESEAHYHSRTGTSYSTGLAAGALSLAMSNYPMLSSDELYQALFEGLTPLDELSCGVEERCVLGGGRLSAAGLVQAAALYAGPPQLEGQVQLMEVDPDTRNYRFQPGEPIRLGISIVNRGPSPAHDIQLAILPLSGREDELHLPDATLALGNLGVGQQTSHWWDELINLTDACVSDGRVPLILELTYQEGVTLFEVELEHHCNLDEDGDGFGRLRDCNDSDPRYYPEAEREAFNCGVPAPSGCQSTTSTTWAWLTLGWLITVRRRRRCYP